MLPFVMKGCDVALGKRRPRGVASPEEVLRVMTQIMRGDMGEDGTGPPKVAERSKAAEMLGKRYGLFGDKEALPPPRPEAADEIDAMMKQVMERYESGGA